MLHSAGKLARLASEVLNDSGALLERVLALAREGIEESSRVSASLSLLLRRLEAAGGQPGDHELIAAVAAARQLKLRMVETVVLIRLLIGGVTIAGRYRWGEGKADTSMMQLQAGLDDLARSAALAAACWTIAGTEMQAIEQGIVAMCEVARSHRSVADRALLTVEKLQDQAAQFVRVMEQARLA
jgi:hypothetical protein